jgi:hypothetical protein
MNARIKYNAAAIVINTRHDPCIKWNQVIYLSMITSPAQLYNWMPENISQGYTVDTGNVHSEYNFVCQLKTSHMQVVKRQLNSANTTVQRAYLHEACELLHHRDRHLIAHHGHPCIQRLQRVLRDCGNRSGSTRRDTLGCIISVR